MASINNNILKKYLTLYDDPSLFSNYLKIAKKYNKVYKEYKDKKNILNNPEKLREEVKKWLFSQSPENRIKICTVENEFLGKMLYQMYLYTKMDKSMKFEPKPIFFNDEDEIFDENFTKNIDINDNIKITKTNKKGQKIEASHIGLNFSQSRLNDFKEEELLECNFGNYFKFQSVRNMKFRIDDDNNINNEISSDDVEIFLSKIIFFTVHHKHYPDSFSLSPNFLDEKAKFENFFSRLGNNKYFTSLIQSKSNNNNNINNFNQKICWYALPEWFSENEYYSISQYAVAFIEQSIMIKFLLNYKKDKKNYIYSLLDEEALNRFFTDRKMVFEYINKNYDIETRINIIQELSTDTIFTNLKDDIGKMKYVNYFNSFKRQLHLKNSHFIENTIKSINNNPYESKNKKKTKNNLGNNTELNLENLNQKLKNLIVNKNNSEFIDHLLFKDIENLWEFEYFFDDKIFEKLTNFITDQNCKELIFESNSKRKSNKGKHKKNNKKGGNNVINDNNIESDSTTGNSIKQNKETEKIITKEEFDELYASDYFKFPDKIVQFKNKEKNNGTNNFKFENIINSNVVIKDENNEQNKINEINEFIKNKLLLGEIFEKVFEKILEINKINNKTGAINDENIKSDNKTELKNTNITSTNILNENLNINIKSLTNDNQKEKNINTISFTDKENNTKKIKKIEEFSKTPDKALLNIIAETNKINDLSENSEIKTKSNSENKNKNIPLSDNINNININLITSSNDKSNKKKKKEKQQEFFLFDTVKKKKNKKSSTNKCNLLISNEFIPFSLKETKENRLPFFEKLHNDIIKHETKVIAILNHLMIFKDFCISEIKRIIQETFSYTKNYDIEIYGSYETGLMIEASDIDIKIKLNNSVDFENFFSNLCNKLQNENKFDIINPIRTASVPVIKLSLKPEKFIIGKEDLELKFKQFKEMSLYKHYLFDISELKNIKVDITFIYENNNKINLNEKLINKNDDENINNEKLINNKVSSVAYVKEQILKYPEVKFILRVLKRYFYIKKMNTSFLGGISSYNLFLLLLSYAIFNRKDKNNEKINLGKFFFDFLEFFTSFNFKECIIDVGSKIITNFSFYPYGYLDINNEKIKDYGYGKSLVIIDPLTGANASRSSYRIDEIQTTFYDAWEFFSKEKNDYERGYKKKKNNNNIENNVVMGLNNQNKNNDNGGGGNIIEKFFMNS